MAATARKSKAPPKTKEGDLTPQEIKDVKQSLKELKEGKGKIVRLLKSSLEISRTTISRTKLVESRIFSNVCKTSC